MMSDFHTAMKFILSPDVEGEYSNDPNDPGGETKWGISKRAYPDLDIRNLTKADALAIYFRDYWTACDCDNIPFPYIS